MAQGWSSAAVYNNQGSNEIFRPLGDGWSHNFDYRLKVVGTQDSDGKPVPVWVESQRGSFYSASDVTIPVKVPSMIQVNGTLFKKYNGSWYAERGKHGTLTEITDGFEFTAKDGTSYLYDTSDGFDYLVSSLRIAMATNRILFTMCQSNWKQCAMPWAVSLPLPIKPLLVFQG